MQAYPFHPDPSSAPLIHLKSDLLSTIQNTREDCPGGPAIRIHLPLQGTWVQALVWEDHICQGATGHVPQPLTTTSLQPAAPQQRRRNKSPGTQGRGLFVTVRGSPRSADHPHSQK